MLMFMIIFIFVQNVSVVSVSMSRLCADDMSLGKDASATNLSPGSGEIIIQDRLIK